MTVVVRCRSREPNRRMARSRRSSRCSRITMVTTKTMNAVSSGLIAGRKKTPREFEWRRHRFAHFDRHRGRHMGLGRRRRYRALRGRRDRPGSACGGSAVTRCSAWPAMLDRRFELAHGETMRGLDLVFDGGLIARHWPTSSVSCVPITLPSSTITETDNQHRREHRGDVAETQAQQKIRQRCDEEAQHDRQRDRNQHVAREVQRRTPP